MQPKLDEVEVRVLGVLMEKSLTQASTYPMTMNAIVLGANQKQNRDPVVEMSEGDVAEALTRLQQKRLVKQAPPSAGARSNRFLHACVETFQWDRRQQAIMSELFLRGRQTPGELRTHASRMTPFPDLEAIGNTLTELSSHTPPFVDELLREPGRAANRWRHLLGQDGEATSVGTVGQTTDVDARLTTATYPPTNPGPQSPIGAVHSAGRASLEGRVEALEAQVAELLAVVSAHHSRLDALAGETAAEVVE